MAGSVWPALVAGARAKASEVEAKFDWIEGDLVPMSGGTRADATYDIATSSHRFRDANLSRNITHGNGSVGAPSIAPSGDPDTGRWYPTLNTIAESVGGTEAMRIRSDGTMTRALQMMFYGYKATGTTDNTGDGSTFTIACDAELFDRGNSFDPTTGKFTCQITGDYLFVTSVEMRLTNTTTANTFGAISLDLINDSSILKSRTRQVIRYEDGTILSIMYYKDTALLKLTAGDVLYPTVKITGFPKIWRVSSGTDTSFFAGYLLG